MLTISEYDLLEPEIIYLGPLLDGLDCEIVPARTLIYFHA